MALTETLRGLHIAAGVAALATFAPPLLSKKGKATHRRVGWVYVAAMFTAAATALGLVVLRLLTNAATGPSIFLAYLALLSFTAAFRGVRVVRNRAHAGPVDWVAPTSLAVAAVALAAYGAQTGFHLALAFAPIGLLVAVPQLRALTRRTREANGWLVEHVSSMVISTIATLTAFLVLNAGAVFGSTHGLVFWLAPTIVGVPLLAYWKRRVRRGAIG